MAIKEKTWLFNWVGGGYNTVTAKTRKTALKRAIEFGKRDPPRVSLVPNEKTLRVASYEDIEAENKAWGPYD